MAQGTLGEKTPDSVYIAGIKGGLLAPKKN